MINYIQEGASLDHVVAGANAVSGDVIVSGSLIGIASKSGLIGETIAIKTDGVYELKKKAALVIAAGDPVHWDTTLKEVTKTPAADTRPLGHAVAAQLAGDAVVRVRIMQRPFHQAIAVADGAAINTLLAALRAAGIIAT